MQNPVNVLQKNVAACPGKPRPGTLTRQPTTIDAHTAPSRPVLALLGMLLALLLAGCNLSGNAGPPTLTPPPAPTPTGSTLFFNAPYNIALPPETRVPGTGIFYQGPQNDVYLFTIQGLQAFKRVDDTINWNGIIAPGVVGNYNLQLKLNSNISPAQLYATGPVRVGIMNPLPREVPLDSMPSSLAWFDNIRIDYVVPQGEQVPGTTLVFQGIQDNTAYLTGGTGYPYFPLGNSVIWFGRLTDRVLVRYDLRVSRLDEIGLGLTGTARLWLTPWSSP